MKRKTIYGLMLVSSALLLTACGSDSKANPGDGARGNAALSIVYESTTSDEGSGKMIGHYHVHAVDEKGNPVSGLPLNLSIINGVKEIRNRKLQNKAGDILSSQPIAFRDSGVDFSKTGVVSGDSLIILPTEGRTNNSYLGDWEIMGVGANLSLKENSFNLETTEDLTYIIGREERLLGGRTVTVAHIEDVNTTITDARGFTNFDVVFDPVLAGHTATIGVHTKGNRMGMSKVITFRGGEFIAPDVTVPVTGETEYVRMRLMIDPGNGGTEDLIDVDIVPNSFTVEPSGSCQLNISKSNFHTDRGGHVLLAVDTLLSESASEGNSTSDSNSTSESNSTTTTDTNTNVSFCTIKWQAGAGAIYFEY